MEKLLRYALYPFLLAMVLAVSTAAITLKWDYGKVYGVVTLVLVLGLIAVERTYPLEPRWSMTKNSFLRDLKFIAAGVPTIALTKMAFGLWMISYSQHHTPLLKGTPLALEVTAYLLAFEFFQYWYHRGSHQLGGGFGRLLWRIHAAHHLPDRVYVVMHAVFNPLNALISTALIQTPLVLLGISPEAALIASLLIDLQGLVSHFNFDLRQGPLAHVFIGTASHRQHHSAEAGNAVNFGTTLAIWDQLFGTFTYDPERRPAELGVQQPELYPPSDHWLEVVLLPLHGSGVSLHGGDYRLPKV